MRKCLLKCHDWLISSSTWIKRVSIKYTFILDFNCDLKKAIRWYYNIPSHSSWITSPYLFPLKLSNNDDDDASSHQGIQTCNTVGEIWVLRIQTCKINNLLLPRILLVIWFLVFKIGTHESLFLVNIPPRGINFFLGKKASNI